MQVVYLGVDPRKQEKTGKEEKLIKDIQLALHSSGDPLSTCVKCPSELFALNVRELGIYQLTLIPH